MRGRQCHSLVGPGCWRGKEIKGVAEGLEPATAHPRGWCDTTAPLRALCLVPDPRPFDVDLERVLVSDETERGSVGRVSEPRVRQAAAAVRFTGDDHNWVAPLCQNVRVSTCN